MVKQAGVIVLGILLVLAYIPTLTHMMLLGQVRDLWELQVAVGLAGGTLALVMVIRGLKLQTSLGLRLLSVPLGIAYVVLSLAVLFDLPRLFHLVFVARTAPDSTSSFWLLSLDALLSLMVAIMIGLFWRKKAASFSSQPGITSSEATEGR